MVKKLSINDFNKIAAEKGGCCLSKDYINQLSKLTWKCMEGHIWDALPKHIRKGSWCPVCARKKENKIYHKNVSIDDLHKIAYERGGVCLSDSYINQTTKLKFKCGKKHIFESSPSSIFRGTWCPFCAGKHKNSIETMHKIAKKNGGKCLSTDYTNVFTKLLWECANGHQFHSIPKHVINGHWCPNCTIYLNEQRCRYILETLFDTKFLKDRDVLNGYELDGYNKDLKLAFEYHGKQHFEYVDFFYSRGDTNLEERKKRDKLKENLCKELGIELLIIPYTVTPDDHVTFIVNELKKRGFHFKVNPKNITFEQYSHTRSELNEIQKIAKNKGGVCLSTSYVNVDSKMDFICKNGHSFSSTPYNIKNLNRWCRKCFYSERAGASQRLRPNEMCEIAKEKGWECLSNEYTNARTKLLWKCGEGHLFERTLGHVKEGRGCPICKQKKTK